MNSKLFFIVAITGLAGTVILPATFKPIFLIIYFILLSIKYSKIIFKKNILTVSKFFIGFATVFSIIMISNTIFFYLWELNKISIFISYLIPLIILPNYVIKKEYFNKIFSNLNVKSYIFFILHVLSLFLFLQTAINSKTYEPTTSLWNELPKTIFILYAISVSLLIISIYKSKKTNALNFISIILQLIATFSLANSVFGINFGFDPFVHQASEKIIIETGTISPKPFLYIGHWAQVVSISILSGIKHYIIDKYITILLASILVPSFLFEAMRKLLKNKNEKHILYTVALLPATLLPFYFSVPQNTAMIFAILAISSAYINKRLFPVFLIASLIVHIFSGISLIIFWVINYILEKIKNIKISKTHLVILLSIFGALTVYIFGDMKLYNLKPNIDIYGWEIMGNFIFKYIPFYSIYHSIYIIYLNYIAIFVFFISLYIFKDPDNKKAIAGFLTFFVITTSNIIWKNIKLPFIEYEIYDFMWRMWYIAISIVLIYFFAGIYIFIKKINKTHKLLSLVSIIILISINTSFLYFLYPRDDGFVKSKLYSTSIYDIKAVEFIEKDAQNKKYIVLANQATSAGALHVLGFKKYYNVCKENKCQDLFFYPIPTTSPLYKTYLDMIEKKPDIQKIKEIQKLTGTDKVYFVVNDYWNNSKKTVSTSKKIFKRYKNIGNGKIYIFIYEDKN